MEFKVGDRHKTSDGRDAWVIAIAKRKHSIVVIINDSKGNPDVISCHLPDGTAEDTIGSSNRDNDLVLNRSGKDSQLEGFRKDIDQLSGYIGSSIHQLESALSNSEKMNITINNLKAFFKDLK